MNCKVKSTYKLLKDLKQNFLEVKSDLKPKEALEEANRCLYCYDAPCIKACPTRINIPSFIKKINSGNLNGAARDIFDANPVGATCSRVCPTEELCEGACVLQNATLPIKIGDLQRYATNWAIQNDIQLFTTKKSNGKTVAIIGGGPAGLSAARELSRLGYAVTIFEAEEKAGGLNTYGIVSFRLPQEVSLWEVWQVEKLGVEIRTNTTVGVDVDIEDIRRNFDAIVLAIGMAHVPNMGIEGEELEGVYDAIQFLKNSKEKELTSQFIGSRIAVVGAGNTAIDAATCALRLGADNVKILYRRTPKEMTAYPSEFEFAKQESVEFMWLTQPKRIIADTNGRVKKLECIRMRLNETNHSNRPNPVPIKGSEFTIEVDGVIKAIGQTRHIDLIEAFDLEHTNGVISINQKTYQTSDPKIFAAGDVIYGKNCGEAMVVTAAEQGKQTAYAIHQQFFKK